MRLTIEETAARLAWVVRNNLQGAELEEFRLVADEGNENAYVVRWTKNTEAAGGFREYGTHRACLHEDGRAMLVWGHYTRNEREAKRDYRERR
jgi:hypothetical protein